MSNPYAGMIAAAAAAYGADSGVLSSIAKRESGFNPGAANHWDSNAKAGHPSEGMFQFIPSTFAAFSKQARAANPQAWRGVGHNWTDPKAQALTTAWAITHGHGGDWATYKAALGDAGHPSSGGYAPPPSSGMAAPIQSAAPGHSATASLFADSSNPEDKWFGDFLASHAGGVEGISAPVQAAPESPVGGSVLPRQPGEAAWRYLNRLGAQFGLKHDAGNSQTTGGKHTNGSYHYRGQAVDFGNAKNSASSLAAWQSFIDHNRKQLGVAELLDEGDHIHVALDRSR